MTLAAAAFEPTLELARVAQEGIEPYASQARHELLVQHAPLISGVVRRAAPPSRLRKDAEQAGVVGFLDALTRFNPERGIPLVAFAKPFVQGAVRAAVYDPSERIAALDIADLREEDEPFYDNVDLRMVDLGDALDAVRAFRASWYGDDIEELSAFFRERWAIPRATRMPSFRDFNRTSIQLSKNESDTAVSSASRPVEA